MTRTNRGLAAAMMLVTAGATLPHPSGAAEWQPDFAVPGVSDAGFGFKIEAMVYGPDPADPVNYVYFVAGQFTEAGGRPANGIAKWDGKRWTALGTGVSGVKALLLTDIADGGMRLYAAGNFQFAGEHIARWDGFSWSSVGGGTSGPINALAVWFPGKIVAGGSFSSAGGVPVSNLAAWDGTAWSSFAGGTGGSISEADAFTDEQGSQSLLVVGEFFNAGGVPATRIARWNGSQWNAFGGGLSFGPVMTADPIVVDEGGTPSLRVVAGGAFTMAGDETVNNIALWDGSAWTALGLGVNSVVQTVRYVNCAGDHIIAGGSFSSADGKPVNLVAEWKNGAWRDAGGFGSGVPTDFVVAKGPTGSDVLWAVGGFTNVMSSIGISQTALGIAWWNGYKWRPLTDGQPGIAVYALAGGFSALGSVLYVSGRFGTGAQGNDQVGRWREDLWDFFGSNATVNALAPSNSGTFAGGNFNTMEGVPGTRNVACWDEITRFWSPLGPGLDGMVQALYLAGSGDLYAGGYFGNSGTQPLSAIARWSASQWNPLGTGMNGGVRAIAEFGGMIYAGGDFTQAGGQTAIRIARWDGSQWSALFPGMHGIQGQVNTFAVYDGQLYVGGGFTQVGPDMMNGVARYNGSTWSPVGSGLNNTVKALAVHEGELYAAGNFTMAGGVPAVGIARWNGSAWSAVDGGVDVASMGALASSAVDRAPEISLFAGGAATQAGDVDSWRLARLGGPKPPEPDQDGLDFDCAAAGSFCCTSTELHRRTPAVARWVEFNPGFAESLVTNYDNDAPTAGDPIIPSTGEYEDERTDLDLGTIRFSRRYGTLAGPSAEARGFYHRAGSPMGVNWVHNYQCYLKRLTATSASFYLGMGRVVFFEKPAAVWQVAAAPSGAVYRGTAYQVVETGSRLELMDPEDGRVYTFEFSSLGNGDVSRLESIRDRNGNTETLSYDPEGMLAAVSDGIGRSLAISYVVAGGFPRIASVTDQAGRSVLYSYSAAGDLTSVQSPRGTITTYAYDAASRATTITRPEGNNPIQNAYNSDGQCISQTDGEGNITTLSYSEGATTVTDPLGNTRTYDFNTEMRLTRFTDEAGHPIQYGYDGSHRVTSTTDRNGGTSTVAYDAPSGYVSARTDNAGNTWGYTYTAQPQDGFTFHVLTRIDYPGGFSATFTHDGRGNVTSATDRAGQVSIYTVNAQGDVLTATNSLGGVTTFVYNADRTLASWTDPAGNTTALSYDATKRPTLITRPGGATRALAYDANDNLLSVTDENGRTTVIAYDDNDNPSSATDPLGHSVTFAWDGNDALVAVTDALGNPVTLDRDGLSRLVAAVDRNGNMTSVSFDPRRRAAQLVDGAGKAWARGYDDESVPASSTNPLGRAWTSTTDIEGRPTAIQDPLLQTSTIQRDVYGRITGLVDPMGSQTNVTRDARGLVTRIALSISGVDVDLDRNGLGQVVGVTDPRGSLWQYAADNQGRRVSRTDPLGQPVAVTYDSRTRPSLITYPGGMGTAAPTWDAASRLTRMLYSDGTDFQYAYDAADRLTAANGIALQYDARGALVACNDITVTRDAGGRITVMTLAPGKTITYGYDERDLPTSVSDWVGGVTTLAYDDAGLLIEIARPNGVTTTYAYDVADRLTTIQDGALSSIALTRNARGQVTESARNLPLVATPPAGSATFIYDAAGQVSGYTYDALGRRTAGGGRTYSWDLAGRLAGYDAGAGPIVFTRDAAGNPISRTEADQTRTFVWNYALGLPSLSIVRESGVDFRFYVYTPGGRLLHSIEAAAGARSFYHYDETGNTLYLTGDGGTVTDAYAYFPFGGLTARTGTTDNPFTFHGQLGVLYETPGDFHLMRARAYDPLTGCFLSRDPVDGLGPLSVNPYQAFFNDPVSLVDPNGASPEPAGPSPVNPYAGYGRRDYLSEGFFPRSGHAALDPGAGEITVGPAGLTDFYGAALAAGLYGPGAASTPYSNISDDSKESAKRSLLPPGLGENGRFPTWDELRRAGTRTIGYEFYYAPLVKVLRYEFYYAPMAPPVLRYEYYYDPRPLRPPVLEASPTPPPSDEAPGRGPNARSRPQQGCKPR